MTIASDSEKISYYRHADLPGVELLSAEHSARLWRVYHETYTVCSTFGSHSARFHYRHKTHVAAPGETSVYEPGEFHDTRKIQGPGRFRVLYFTPSWLESASAELGRGQRLPHLRACQLRAPSMFRAFAKLHDSIEHPATALERQSRAVQCIGLLLELSAEQGSKAVPAKPEKLAVRKARDLILDRYQENIRLEDLSNVSRLSRFHLLRSFSKEVGVSPHAFLIHVRITKARTLLAKGLPPAVVAADLGFVDQSHLHFHFKRSMGVTPGEYIASATHPSIIST